MTHVTPFVTHVAPPPRLLFLQLRSLIIMAASPGPSPPFPKEEEEEQSLLDWLKDRVSIEAKLQRQRDRRFGILHLQMQKKLDEMKKDMQDEHKDTRDTVVGGFEACRQGIAALDERASERDRQFRALLADQRQKEKHESDEKQRKKRLEEEKVVKEIQEMRNKFDEQTAQLTTLVQTLSAVKAPRDSRDSRSSSPPITNLFIGGSGSAASNALVSRDDIDSSITAVQSPPAVAPRPRRTFLQTPKAIRTPKAKAHLDTFSRALEELDSNATMTSNADVPSRVVKLQHVRNVAPTTTPHTARMEISEDQHVVRALEGRSISRFGRRCEGKIEKSPTATGTALRAQERLRRSNRVKTRAQKKQG